MARALVSTLKRTLKVDNAQHKNGMAFMDKVQNLVITSPIFELVCMNNKLSQVIVLNELSK